MIRILFVGDVVGRPGRQWLAARVASLREEWELTFIIANAENAAGGAGLTGTIARELLGAGIDALTLGDHVWDQRSFDVEIESLDRVCRPANLPPGNPGRPWLVLERAGVKLGVFTVLGRQYLALKSECPFLGAERVLQELANAGADLVLAEIHAEATSEKIAFGRHFDGRAALIVGTHTHVPTADACVLPGGSAYITDVGMTGPYDSVLGREVKPVIDRFLDGRPRRLEVAKNDVRISAVLAEIDPATKRAVSVRLVTIAQESG